MYQIILTVFLISIYINILTIRHTFNISSNQRSLKYANTIVETLLVHIIHFNVVKKFIKIVSNHKITNFITL